VLTRAIPLVVIASAAFAVGIVAAASPDAPAAQRFVDAWEAGDTEAMYAELTPEAQADFSLQRFQRTYDDAAVTATIADLSTGEVQEQGDAAVVPVRFHTHIFGDLGGDLALPISDDKVAWTPNLAYPGLSSDERLSRRTRAPARAAILAADRTPLSAGPAAARTVGTAALAVVGEVGTPSRAQERELALHGFPPASLTGTSGLELAFNERLAGQPGGQLLALSPDDESQVGGGRVLATSEPVRGKAVRTTIDPDLQQTAVEALGSLYGGAAVLDAKKGSVLALAGLAYSAPQPPGSTFKIITATGALDAGVVKLSDQFPVESSNSEIGREIPNAHDELCGGSFAQAFADSCNTVFAPLGARLGGEKLVKTAELFGFNSPPALFDDATAAIVNPVSSTIPATLSESVETGESAIGQGQVLATPLEMATVAQTIANKGVRLPTPIARGEGLQPSASSVEVTSPETAATMTDLMIGVVTGGTGVAGALPGIQVAGKTGTAELGPAALEPGQTLGPGEDPPQETDAWFTAFAPAGDPKIAVAVMVVNSDGDGGTVAAPIVRQIMAAYFGVA
jgi:cell division protein FtsI/penicillin-binding protein 2